MLLYCSRIDLNGFLHYHSSANVSYQYHRSPLIAILHATPGYKLLCIEWKVWGLCERCIQSL